MEVRGAHVQVQDGYPKQVWQNLQAHITEDSGAGGGVSGLSGGEKGSGVISEDKVMHYVVKVDR